MNRSGYSEDCEGWALIRWRGAVASAIRGRRGQAFLKEMLAALDALPEPHLISGELEAEDGSVCALGAVGRARGIDMAAIDSYDRKTIAAAFGISEALAAEIMFVNDEPWWWRTGEVSYHHLRLRFTNVHWWAEDQIIKQPQRG